MLFAIKISTVNETWYAWKETEEQMLDFVMNDHFHVDRTEEWKEKYFATDDNPSCIEEKDGKLYSHWVWRKYSTRSLLFAEPVVVGEEYGSDELPNTIAGLREYLRSGRTIVSSRDSRSPVSYKMFKLEYARSGEKCE